MTRSLKIWLPTIRAGSGADVFSLRLAEALERAGHEPKLQWFDHRYELMPWRLASFAPPDGTDVVHANSWQGFAFKRLGIPLVVTEHQYISHPAFAPYRRWYQRMYHRYFIERCMRRSFEVAAAVVAVSEHCANAMRANLNRPVDVIYNWVDTDRFSPLRQVMRSAQHEGVTKLLFVGNPAPWKGTDLLPGLASALGADVEIHCLGGLRKSAKAVAAPPNMTFLDRVAPNDMPDVYRSVDVALALSRYEAFGYVALEAMACGLPVTGFSSPGVAEICAQGKTALLSPVDDLDQLVTNIRRLASDADLRKQLGSAGRRRAVELFSEASSIGAYIDVYERVSRH